MDEDHTVSLPSPPELDSWLCLCGSAEVGLVRPADRQLTPAGSPSLGSLGAELQSWGQCWYQLHTKRAVIRGSWTWGQLPALPTGVQAAPPQGSSLASALSALEPEGCPSATRQPAVSEVEARGLICRLWVGGQDVVGNNSPTLGAGVAFVCVPW